MENVRDEVRELCIGLKVRRLRQDRRLTLQNLSAITGLSKPLLSQIENDQVIPPIATLLRIARGLKVGLHTFFQEDGDLEKCLLVRADSRRKLQRRSIGDVPPPPYDYHSLAYGKRNKSMEPFLVEFQVATWRDELLVRHVGEEFLFLLEGQLEMHFGGQVMTLNPGDAVYYESTEPHGFVAAGERPARALAVLFSHEF